MHHAGVHNGMPYAAAKALCPSVVAAPYSFAAYEATSKQLYQALLALTHNIQAVSCDEALIEVGDQCRRAMRTPDEPLRTAAERVAEELRQDFFARSQCTCSVGIGVHPLAARVACSLAKPDGKRSLLSVEQTRAALAPMELSALPSVGSSTARTLRETLGITTCGQLAVAAPATLAQLLGKKRAATMQAYARGTDTRALVRFRSRASVGLCVTWGVRLRDQEAVSTFVQNLTVELCRRLRQLDMLGSSLTFTVCRPQKHKHKHKLKQR